MGWERKRGKLHELNLLLRGHSGLSFATLEGNMGTCSAAEWRALMCSIRYVITLDADTILPPGAARRLVGTLAHPLNRADFDPQRRRIRAGYSVLQPRVDIQPRSQHRSRFTRLFAGDTGLDLYTRAVSDVYQDLFGEGIYVGKGIYDVDAFMRSTEGRIPENAILSHDLIEGLMGRVGLATDINLIEDYPPHYFLYAIRQRRWIRGDWQILPWLVRRWLDPPADAARAGLTAISRWKIFDNLRRTLVAPALLAIFVLGTLGWPQRAGFWALAVALTYGVPLIAATAQGAGRLLRGDRFGAAFRGWGDVLGRCLLAAAFVPYEAYLALDAILTTLYRLAISHRRLLQWTTAAHTARLFGAGRRRLAWQKMGLFSILSLGLTATLWGRQAPNGALGPTALAWAAPLLLLWMGSPLIAWWINRPAPLQRMAPLADEQAARLRQLSRRTWGFFERFVGPEDHWLPPDHYQESPVGIVAHRTSPTNIGLLFTSTLAAYDLGYMDQFELGARLVTLLDAIERLEHHRGHLLNWYDTVTLQPLQPRYVSTVDSGNLTACLIVTAQACRALADEPVFRRQLWLGYQDALAISLRHWPACASQSCCARPIASSSASWISPMRWPPPRTPRQRAMSCWNTCAARSGAT
jgi:cyclic beta-1,2-glucan synthetase